MNEPPVQYAPTLKVERGALSFAFRRRRARNWLLLGLLYAGYYLCRYNLGTITPELAREFGFNNKQTGQISSGRDFGYAIGTFVNGLFSDALGGKKSMAIGALGTVALNLAFGFVSGLDGWDIAALLFAFTLIRVADGYMQSFGSPGMVKINTSWFQRRERGKFAGIFGAVIQLGQFGVNQLSAILVAGLTLTIAGSAYVLVNPHNWRIMFYVPPAILAVILVCMWLGVKEHPEDAGYHIPHDDDAHAADPHARLPIMQVFFAIASNPLVWINAGAYFCTGFVRRAYDYWYAKYMDEAWHIGKASYEFWVLSAALPVAAVAGSFLAGFLSDVYFKGKRSPVAVGLYGVETLVILGSAWLLGSSGLANSWSAVICLSLISLTCNSSHSIIGTAVAMDIGGRKMSGFALGVVNSFQYWGGFLAGYGLGGVIDKALKDWGPQHGWNALFFAMAPFSALGCILMLYVAVRTRGRDVKGS